MNKIETEFDKLKRYEDIETYYPPLEDIKDFLYELFGDRVESQKYIIRANKQIQELTNNWNELRQHIKEYLEEWQNSDDEWVKGKCDMARDILYDMEEIREGNK